jgi:hypothetical protein
MDTDVYRTRIHKFSCKPPGHDAARQRENQRRHRARVKGRITELEELLSSTQSRLEDTLKQIQHLTAEVQRLQDAPGARPATSTHTTTQQPFLEPEISPGLNPFDIGVSSGIPEQTLTAFDPLPTLTTTNTHREIKPTTPEPNLSSTRALQTTSQHPLAALPTSSPPISDFEDADDDCARLPPPSPGESTIPCREAYAIIKDRSPPEFDLSAATEWLLPGFRCAVVPGTGCRVQTHILFAFVDHITPM